MNQLNNDIGLVLKQLTPRQKIIGAALLAAFIASIIGFVLSLNRLWLVEIPTTGGELVEGVIGQPRFVNPILALSNTDRDLVSLIYSGLMRLGPDGQLIPDLAEKYEVSDDKLTYIFTLREGLRWHNGWPITAEDVAFTIERVIDPELKSQRRAQWEGVETTVINDRQVKFILRQPYPSFLETTTLGILPKHLWSQVGAEAFSLNPLNIESIGSGPYRIKKIIRNSDNVPTSYELKSFRDFAINQPKLKSVVMKFYNNEEELLQAYERQEIESIAALSAQNAKTLQANGATIITAPLPRIFALFFNQNKARIFTDQAVRQALNQVIDRQAIVDHALQGFAEVTSSPLPAIANTSNQSVATTSSAAEILTKAGWEKDSDGVWQKKIKEGTQRLAFSISTSDTPELKQAAEMIAVNWRQFGAEVDVKVFELGTLNQNVIRPRDYETLFFGEIIGRALDLYPFWHSSQRLDPGLNIALYTNITVDKLLDNLRSSTTTDDFRDNYLAIEREINRDSPAVFVYSPVFLYVVPPNIKNIVIPPLNLSAERFSTMNPWFEKTDHVWKIFARN